MDFSHKSVLLNETIELLNIRPDGIYLDGTLGGAGHSLEICRRLTGGRLIGIDRDTVALNAARERLKEHMDKVTLVHGNFSDLGEILDSLDFPKVDGMLFDLGVSSPQLDDGERGFSYMTDAPLDMRMNRDDALTAYEIVNTWPREELRRILFEYGEERYAPLVAAAIERTGSEHPIKTTLELASVIRGAISYTQHIGHVYRSALAAGQDYAEAVAKAGEGFVALRGKIRRNDWVTEDGYTIGTMLIDGSGEFAGNEYKIWYQNENLQISSILHLPRPVQRKSGME